MYRKTFDLGGLAEARVGIRTEEGEEMAKKRFQLDERKADIDGDGSLSDYEKARGEAIQKAMADDDVAEMAHGGYMNGGCGCDACQAEAQMGFGTMIVGHDPVSGNPVPPGSDEENVRDDLPAVLSDGEYVVPADVVRYHGLKTFMEMREEAKLGLMAMAFEGQIQTIEAEDEEYEEDPEAEEYDGEEFEDADVPDEDSETEEGEGELPEEDFEYETPDGNTVEIAALETETETLDPEEDEDEMVYASDYGYSYRPKVKIVAMS